MGNQAKLSG